MTDYTDKDRPVHKRRELIKLVAAGEIGFHPTPAFPHYPAIAKQESQPNL